MRTSFPDIPPLPLTKALLGSQEPHTLPLKPQNIMSPRDEVLFGTKPVPSPNPFTPSKNNKPKPTQPKKTPEELAAMREKQKQLQKEKEETRKARLAISPKIFVNTSVQIPLPEQYFFGYVLGTSVAEFLGLKQPKPYFLASKANHNAAAKILANPDDLAQLWLRLGMPDSEIPDVDWNQEAVVFIAQSRTRQSTLKPKSINYSRQTDTLMNTIPAESKPGKELGMAWYLGVIPLAGDLTEDEQQRRKMHQELHDAVKALPKDKKHLGLVLGGPPKFSVLSQKTKAVVLATQTPKK